VLLFTHLDLSTLNQAWKQAGLEGGFSKKQRHELLDQVKALMLKEQEPAVAGFSPYQGKQILVVEDSPTVRGFVRRALVSGLKGCVVREAEDGKAALTELALGRVHCITTDLQMPGMDGWTFLATVRQNPVLKTKPIIVFSSVITPEMTQAYKNDPFIRFIDKPSVGARVAQVVREMLALKC
jgi:CheY-like chemotaxis protein